MRWTIGALCGLMFLGMAGGAEIERVFPASGAKDVCPDTPLRITLRSNAVLGSAGKIRIFDASNNTEVETIDLEKPQFGPATSPAAAVGPAAVRMLPERAAPSRRKSIGGLPNYNYYPVIMTGSEAEIFPATGALAYGKSYYVTIDAGAFRDGQGNSAAIDKPESWRFTTKLAAPAQGSARLTVAADGTGDFSTVQGALDFIPAGNTAPVTIFVRKGVYTEMIYVANKNAITIVGEDRKQTVIQYATNDGFNNSAGGGGYRRGVFRANRCNDLTLTSLTIRNTTPQGGTQAETIILNGTATSAIITNVDLYSFQDTLQINGQAYVSNCYIEGDVDFMWGNGPCFFENCTAKTVRSNAYFTQIRNTANHGYVYYRCTFDGAAGITGNMLSRIDPGVYPNSEVVLIDCVMSDAVSPVAWRFDRNPNGPNVRFWEYNSHFADGRPVDVSSRFAASRQLKQPDDAELIKNYSDPTFVLGNEWNPRRVRIPTTEAMKD